jgi:NAD(P)-dependent dehydrogenase (short-subunit alcohol dehydrogenase family)
VTGGAGTLGFEAARALLEHGLAGLMIFDVNTAQAQAKIEELAAQFPAAQIKSKNVEITDEVAVGEAVAETAQILGSIDVLLCFAGVVGCTHAIDMTAAEWRRVLDINTTGSCEADDCAEDGRQYNVHSINLGSSSQFPPTAGCI